jgi:hypothetical protein
MAHKFAKVARDSLLAGEVGHEGVQIYAVDTFQFQNDIFALEFGDRGSDAQSCRPVGFLSAHFGPTAA